MTGPDSRIRSFEANQVFFDLINTEQIHTTFKK